MERKTNTRSGTIANPPMAAATKIEAGKMVCINAAGYAVEGSAATGLKAMGRAEKTVDNTGGANGAGRAEVRKGVFLYKNSGSDAVTIADVGNTVYIEDDETVSRTDMTGTRSAAGTMFESADDGVWVEFR